MTVWNGSQDSCDTNPPRRVDLWRRYNLAMGDRGFATWSQPTVVGAPPQGSVLNRRRFWLTFAVASLVCAGLLALALRATAPAAFGGLALGFLFAFRVQGIPAIAEWFERRKRSSPTAYAIYNAESRPDACPARVRVVRDDWLLGKDEGVIDFSNGLEFMGARTRFRLAPDTLADASTPGRLVVREPGFEGSLVVLVDALDRLEPTDPRYIAHLYVRRFENWRSEAQPLSGAETLPPHLPERIIDLSRLDPHRGSGFEWLLVAALFARSLGDWSGPGGTVGAMGILVGYAVLLAIARWLFLRERSKFSSKLGLS